MWFTSVPVDLSFGTSAPNVLLLQVVAHAPAGRLYEILLTGENQAAWAQGYVRTRWCAGSPYDRGAVRDIQLRWIGVRERLLALEPGRRFAFSSDALTLPLVRRMLEDIQFEPLGVGRTRIDWRVGYELRGFLRPFHRWLRPVFARMFTDFAQGLADYAARFPSQVAEEGPALGRGAGAGKAG